MYKLNFRVDVNVIYFNNNFAHNTINIVNSESSS